MPPPDTIEPVPPMSPAEKSNAKIAEARIKAILSLRGVRWEDQGLGAATGYEATRIYCYHGDWPLTAEEIREMHQLCPSLRASGVVFEVPGCFYFWEWSPIFAR